MEIYRPRIIALPLAVAIVLFLVAPLIAVVPISFTPTKYLSMPAGELSLRHYQTLMQDPRWRDSLMLSLWVGIVSSFFATALSAMFALGAWFLRPRMAAALIGFVMLPIVAPPVVSAITLYFFLTSLSRLSAAVGYDTWPGVAMAHVIMIAPYAVILILVALSQVDRRIDMAARSMGANLRQRIFSIILPNIRFGLLSALFLTFILSWEEIGVTLFITSVQAITLPRLVWMGLRDNVDPAVAAVSVLLILATVIVLGIVMILRSRLARSMG